MGVGAVVTSMFSHGGLLHLLGNTFFMETIWKMRWENSLFSFLSDVRVFCRDCSVPRKSLLQIPMAGHPEPFLE